MSVTEKVGGNREWPDYVAMQVVRLSSPVLVVTSRQWLVRFNAEMSPSKQCWRGLATETHGEPVERKHWALRPQKPVRLIKDGEVGGSGIFISNTYSLH